VLLLLLLLLLLLPRLLLRRLLLPRPLLRRLLLRRLLHELLLLLHEPRAARAAPACADPPETCVTPANLLARSGGDGPAAGNALTDRGNRLVLTERGERYGTARIARITIARTGLE
jgi:hypothetical protein